MTEKSLEHFHTKDFKLAEHAYRCFNVSVPHTMTKEELTNPVLFQNVAARIPPPSKESSNSEIRVVSDDGTFMARLLVMFVAGSDVKVRVIEYHEFDKTDYSKDDQSEYFVELRGSKGWCVVKRSDGSRVIENIADRSTAERELADYRKALAA